MSAYIGIGFANALQKLMLQAMGYYENLVFVMLFGCSQTLAQLAYVVQPNCQHRPISVLAEDKFDQNDPQAMVNLGT